MVAAKASKVESDPFEDDRNEAEGAFVDALYAWFRPQFNALQAWLNDQRAGLEAAQAEAKPAVEKAAGIDIFKYWTDDNQSLVAAFSSSELNAILEALVKQASQDTKFYVSNDLGVQASWDIYDAQAEAWAKQYKFDLIKDLNDSTRSQLGRAIAQWITTDEDFASLVERVWRIVPTDPYPMLRDRAQVIAATETTRIYAEARYKSMQAAGLKHARWRTAEDEIVCPYCGPLGKADEGRGARSGPDGKFLDPVTGNKIDKPPRHVSCRCWIVEDTEELEDLAKQQPKPKPAAAPKPIKPKKPAAPKKPKVPKPTAVPEPEPTQGWKGAMLPEEVANWTTGPFKGQQFYAQIQPAHWNKVKAGGLATETVSEPFGKAVTLFGEKAKPAGGFGQLVAPVQVNVKKPFVAKDAKYAQDWAKKNGWKKEDGTFADFLKSKGYDAVAYMPQPGIENLEKLFILDPSNVVTTVNRYGKPSTSTWKPPKKPKAPKTPAAVPPPKTYNLVEMDIDHDLMLGKDLHSSEGGPFFTPVAGKKLAQSYGAAVFDDQGRMLLRRPAGMYDGYAWTVPKGRVDPGEHPLKAAVREIGEETGHTGQVIGFLPGSYTGGTSKTSMFVMRSVGHDPALMDAETEELRWVSKSEAKELILQGTNKPGIKRDLKIVDDAFEEFDKLQDPLYRNHVKQAIAELPDAPTKPKLKPKTPVADVFPHEPESLTMQGHAPGASHTAYLYDAPDGSRWMFKPQPEFLSEIDRAAYKMASAVGNEAAETYVVKINGQTGSIQRWYSDAKTTVMDLGDKLSPEQTVSAQKEAIFDWLIGNNDGHGKNLLILKNGQIAGIDKGQAFKFWEVEKLDWTYNPPRNPTYSWHSATLQRYVKGENVYLADLDHPELAGFLDRIQNLDDDEFKAILRPFAEKAVQAQAPWDVSFRRTGLPFDDVDKFLESAVARKNNIKRDWIDYYARAKAARAKALGIPLPKTPDVLTPIDAKLVAEVKASGWQGKAMLLGGADVENMTALVYEIDGDGTVVEMKVRPNAEAKMFAALGNVPQTYKPAQANVNDPYWDEVLKVAKSYGYHYKPGQDGIVPPHTKTAVAQLTAKLAADPSPLAQHYKPYIDELHAAINAGTKDMVDKVVKQYVPPPPKKDERPEARSPRRFDLKAEQPEALGVRNENGRIVLAPGSNKRFNGSGFSIGFDSEINASYIGHGNGNGNIYSKQGTLRFVLQGKADEDKLRRVASYMNEIGLDGRLATKQDVEWMYLIKTTYAAGDDLGRLITPSLPISEQIKQLQTHWSKKLGVADVTKLDSYNPMPVYDSPASSLKGAKNGAFGLPRWRRFDISESAFGEQMKDYTLVHSLTNGDLIGTMRQVLQNNGGLVSTEEKFRIGIPIGGMSPDSDQSTGGATYVFTRLCTKDQAKAASYQFLFDPKLLLDTDVISYSHDAFGKSTPDYIRDHRNRSIDRWKAASSSNTNEVIVKRNLSFTDYLTGINCRSEAEKAQIIEMLEEAGIKRLGGKTLNQAIRVAASRY